ncbi:hypothetical protein [Lacticaseibacillus sharpeae]|uniref:Uncharacterized protein n=1 Tax=Lacticaseibacillus sharpeae JCM 1186 = DSM 20505 TaxID=1291052 RepID=A0A0R1ZKD7_9LACO|nr:hypothetical protein [Lacticaseibacillus sharpeae]KRM55425.1 hypothetical protein FC18_GL001320 [Lacticaseibacillus sharpeae JCM 1186 = DSM 20505]
MKNQIYWIIGRYIVTEFFVIFLLSWSGFSGTQLVEAGILAAIIVACFMVIPQLLWMRHKARKAAKQKA